MTVTLLVYLYENFLLLTVCTTLLRTVWNTVVCYTVIFENFDYIRTFVVTAKVDDKIQRRKVKSIAILVHSDETQFYICSMDEKVCIQYYRIRTRSNMIIAV